MSDICAFYASNHIMDDKWKRHSILVPLQSSKEVDKWLLSNSNIGVDLLFAEYQFDSAYGSDNVVYILECKDEVWKRMLKELDVSFKENA